MDKSRAWESLNVKGTERLRNVQGRDTHKGMTQTGVLFYIDFCNKLTFTYIFLSIGHHLTTNPRLPSLTEIPCLNLLPKVLV